MEQIRKQDYLGNIGFSLIIDKEIIAEVQGHYLADSGEIIWCLFEILGNCCEDEWLFFKTKQGVFDVIREQLNFNGRQTNEAVKRHLKSKP